MRRVQLDITGKKTLSRVAASKLIKQKRIKSVDMVKRSTPRKREPVYEKLEPNSCYIISKSSKDVLYACNVKGEIKVKRAKLPKGSS